MNPDLQKWLKLTSQPQYTQEFTGTGFRPIGQAPKGNPLLKTLLSIGGGTLGAIGGTLVGGPAGTIAGGALGSGAGTALGRALGGQAVFGQGGAGEIALDTALGGLFSGGVGKLVKGGAQVGKGALQIGAKEVAAQTAKGLGESAGVAAGKEAGQLAIQRAAKGAAQKAPKDIFAKAAGAGESLAQRELGFIPGTKLGGQALTPSKAKDLYKFAQETVGIKGTELIRPGKAFTKFENFRSGLYQPLENALKKSNFSLNKLDAEGLRKVARSQYGYGINVQDKAIKAFEDNIVKDLASADATKLVGIKRKLDADIIKWGKAKEANDTVKEQIGKIFRKEIDKKVTSSVPGTGTINNALSKSYQAEELLGKANIKDIADASGMVQFGLKKGKELTTLLANAPVSQSVLKGVSAVNTLGGRAVSPTLLSSLARQTARGAVSPVAQQMISPQQQQTQDIQDMTSGMADTTGMMGDMGGGTMGTGQDMGQQSQIDSYFQGLAMQDLQQTGGKRLAAIKAAYDLFGGGKSQKSVTQQNAERKLSQAVNTVGLLQQQFQRAGGGQGFAGYGQTLAGALKLPSADAAKSYQDNRRGFAALISKSLGESGVLTDQDIKRALANIPDITDTPGVAQTKWNNLMQVLQGGYANVGSDTRFNF